VWDGQDGHREGEWYGKRFVVEDRIDEKGQMKMKMSMKGTDGKYFPFGGGTHMCPGRVFARQEVLGAAAAAFLVGFDVQWVGWVDGQEEAGFPQVARQYSGNGVVVHMQGDTRVRIRRRTRS
jgi:hypothetical protein